MSDADNSWRSRLPSSRKSTCDGCYEPKNQLTTKAHRGAVWKSTDIRFGTNIDENDIENARSGVYLPCKYCGDRRFLPLGSFSLDVARSDRDQYKFMGLTKDDRYNSLIGIENQERLGFQKAHDYQEPDEDA